MTNLNQFDAAMRKLLEFKEAKLPYVDLSKDIIEKIIETAMDIFKEQPNLIELDPPLNICGDIHGQFADLLRLLAQGKHPPETNYLFLGDYVDRGRNSIEVLCLLLIYKIRHPELVFMLRGNHETIKINAVYGFLTECRSRHGLTIFNKFNELFAWMPLAAIVGDKIFCCHGGLSPELKDPTQILDLTRPLKDVPDEGLTCDILWADPGTVPGWSINDRGISFIFGPDVLKMFLLKHNLDLLCRAHQVVNDGYEFFADRKGVTLFSSPAYMNEYDNAAAMMHVASDMKCSFRILRPRITKVSSESGIKSPDLKSPDPKETK